MLHLTNFHFKFFCILFFCSLHNAFHFRIKTQTLPSLAAIQSVRHAPAPSIDHSQGLHLNPDLPKTVFNQLIYSSFAQKLMTGIPPTLKSILMSIYPADLSLFIFFQLTYTKILRFAHRNQIHIWNLLALGTPYPWEKSILGFVEERCRLLSRLMGGNYIIKLVCKALARLGFRIRGDFASLLSNISYTLFIIHFIDLFKGQFMKTFFPTIAENRRQNYVVNRSASVIIWIIGGLVVCEMVSTYLKIPLSSTLAFGGVGGLAIGLSARDIAANFLGGMLLLFNEPFTPGDMVTFRAGNTEFVGRVERVGWGQTRIRGRDTRPTYIPNSHFVQTAVTNMERITHRKFEATVPVRFQDYAQLPTVISKIKERLRLIPKLDVLSMPFRISFVKIGPYYLEIEITVYFATKSIDEFLTLQQTANIEIIKAIKECGADLALPMTVVSVSEDEILANLLKNGLSKQERPQTSDVTTEKDAFRSDTKKYFTDENIQNYSSLEKDTNKDITSRALISGESGGFISYYNDLTTPVNMND